jgi:hypothetical protein
MVVAAGTIRFSFVKFVIADGLAALVSGGLFMWLGMKFGQNLGPIQKKIHHYSTQIFIGLIFVAVGLALYVWWRKRGHRAPSEIAVDTIQHVAEHGVKLPHLHPRPKNPAPNDAPGPG